MTIRDQYPARISACPACHQTSEHIPSPLAQHAGERHMRLFLGCNHYGLAPLRLTQTFTCSCCKQETSSPARSNSAIAEVCFQCWEPCAASRGNGGGCVRATPDSRTVTIQFLCGTCQSELEASVRLDDAETLQQCRCGTWNDLSEKIDDERDAR